MEEVEAYQADIQAEEIIPIEQGVITFYGQPILVVRLPDERPAVVVRSLCENMGLDRLAQVRRIQRTTPIAQDLIGNVRIETDGGQQHVQVLILRSVPYWLTGIDHKRVRLEMQADVLRYQCEAVDVLYSWAQQPRSLPAPGDQIVDAGTSPHRHRAARTRRRDPRTNPGTGRRSHTRRAGNLPRNDVLMAPLSGRPPRAGMESGNRRPH